MKCCQDPHPWAGNCSLPNLLRLHRRRTPDTTKLLQPPEDATRAQCLGTASAGRRATPAPARRHRGLGPPLTTTSAPQPGRPRHPVLLCARLSSPTHRLPRRMLGTGDATRGSSCIGRGKGKERRQGRETEEDFSSYKQSKRAEGRARRGVRGRVRLAWTLLPRARPPRLGPRPALGELPARGGVFLEGVGHPEVR